MSSFELLQSVSDKVDTIYEFVQRGVNQQPLSDRISRIESALFSGSGSGIVITSASIAAVLSSTNFAAGVSGWRIEKNGDVEFQNGTFRGAIFAASGSFTGGITIGTGGSLSSGQTAYNVGAGFWLEYNGGTPRFSLGVAGGAGMVWDGTALSISGGITATSGNITGTLYVGASAPRIIIDGSNKLLKSENYSAGVSGWQIDKDGKAEFQDVTVRGNIRASVFTYNEISATAGRSIIAPSAGILYADITTVASPTTFNVDIKDPDSGHYQSFNAGDILRLTIAGTTNWLTVGSVSDQTTFYRYVCTLSNGSPATFKAGTAVVSYGQSGDGVIINDAQAATGPFIQVATHAGAPWATLTERVRIGNLNGWGGFSSDTYGFALGDYAGGSYMYFDPATNNTKLVNGGGAVTIDYQGLRVAPGGADLSRNVSWKFDSSAGVYGSIGHILNSGSATSTLNIKASNYANDTSPYYSNVRATISVTSVNTTGSRQRDTLIDMFAVDNDDANTYMILEAGTPGAAFYSGRARLTLNLNGIRINNTGATVNEFSTDGTLGGNSDTAVPTEKAVKTYVDGKFVLDALTVSKLVASDGSPDPALAIDASGNATLGAGTGTPIFSIDGGSAAEARLSLKGGGTELARWSLLPGTAYDRISFYGGSSLHPFIAVQKNVPGTQLADDAATSWATSGANQYFVMISANGGEYCFAWIPNNATCVIIAQSGFTATAGAGTLTGTTGNDGTFNIRVSSGTLYLENRTGGQRHYTITVLDAAP